MRRKLSPHSGRPATQHRLAVLVAIALVSSFGLSACSALPDDTFDLATDWALDQLIDATDPNRQSGGSLFDANTTLVESELSALDTLSKIPAKGRAPKQGYDREKQFGTAWADLDRNGCDTRNDVLQRDLDDTVIDDRCRVLSGVLFDPFTGGSISFERGQDTSAEVQIDHVVSLSDAWQTGAQQISESDRFRLANDPLNLLAVDGPTNSAKGDNNAASWLPPNREFRCHYVARQISVKAEYHLWVTEAEREAMSKVLQTCPEQPAYRSVLATPGS